MTQDAATFIVNPHAFGIRTAVCQLPYHLSDNVHTGTACCRRLIQSCYAAHVESSLLRLHTSVGYLAVECENDRLYLTGTGSLGRHGSPSGEGDEGTAKAYAPMLRVFGYMRPANVTETLNVFPEGPHDFVRSQVAFLCMSRDISFDVGDHCPQLF